MQAMITKFSEHLGDINWLNTLLHKTCSRFFVTLWVWYASVFNICSVKRHNNGSHWNVNIMVSHIQGYIFIVTH